MEINKRKQCLFLKKLICLLLSAFTAFPAAVHAEGETLVLHDGVFYYEKDGVVDESKFGFVSYDGGIFLVAYGKVASEINGLFNDPDNPEDWYYLSNGQVVSYTGLVLYDGAWFYVNNGKMDTLFTGITAYDTGYFLVGAGRVMTEAEGLMQDPQNSSDWYYFADGQVQTQFSGSVEYNGAVFNVINGKFTADAVVNTTVVYRLSEPGTTDSYYTVNEAQKNNLMTNGWIYEGISWYAPENGDPVYQLYNPQTGEHFYTADDNRRMQLEQAGWLNEGISFYSGGNVPVYQAYNPEQPSHNHNFTADLQEHQQLISEGWIDEGIAWYSSATGQFAIEGIDISEWNGNIDLTAYKGGFVIIRAGYGSSDDPSSANIDNYSQVDKKLRANIEKCEALGIPYGLYWFSYATDNEGARLEAETFLAVTKNYNPPLGYWCDQESAPYKVRNGWTWEKADAITDTFCSVMTAAGKKTGVYASYSPFKYYLTTDLPKWVAHYGREGNGRDVDVSDVGNAVMHQYTSDPIDRNIMLVPIERLFQ